MSVELHHDGKILTVDLRGKLTKDDYEQFRPEVERLIKLHGKLRILVEMVDFLGWTAGGLWQDIKFEVKHFRDVERLALVGDKEWEHGMADFCELFTCSDIRYYELSELDLAEAWIHDDLLIARESGEPTLRLARPVSGARMSSRHA